MYRAIVHFIEEVFVRLDRFGIHPRPIYDLYSLIIGREDLVAADGHHIELYDASIEVDTKTRFVEKIKYKDMTFTQERNGLFFIDNPKPSVHMPEQILHACLSGDICPTTVCYDKITWDVENKLKMSASRFDDTDHSTVTLVIDGVEGIPPIVREFTRSNEFAYRYPLSLFIAS